VATNVLNLRKHVVIRIGSGDSIQDVCIKVADQVEPYSTKEGFERIVEQISHLASENAVQRIMANLRTMAESGELPIFLDEGGVLDSDGRLQEPLQAVLGALTPNDTAYLFLVSTRKPQQLGSIAIPAIQLRPLKDSDTKRLIAKLAAFTNLQPRPKPAELSELSEYVAGYPPSAYFAIQQAKHYGLDLVMREKAGLVQFRTTVFLQHLQSLKIDPKQQEAIKLLASYSPLPFSVISRVLGSHLEEIHDPLLRLIDQALVITTEEGFYRIADPVEDAALKAFGYLPDETHKLVARELSSFLDSSEMEIPRLELSRVMFRAASLAKDAKVAQSAVHLADDLIKLTEKSYHARRFGDAVEFGFAAVNERPTNQDARGYLVRALIQEERWVEALAHIEELRKHAPLREVYFLQGFLARRRGNQKEAIHAYEESKKLGKRGAAISRELAVCYYEINDHDKAAQWIKKALDQHGDNPYIIDLWAQIATRQHDEPGARNALRRLESIDKPVFFHHRRSRIELAFGNPKEAKEAAVQALNAEDRPPFEVVSQLALCEIELGNLSSAESLLNELQSKFPNVRRDVQTGLRCRLEICKGRFANALNLLDRISDKITVFYKKLRHDALIGELKSSALKDVDRQLYEKEIARLALELTSEADPFDSKDIGFISFDI